MNELKDFPELEKLMLRRALRDAAAKVAGLKDRLRDEFDQAEAEGREPFPIQPLTEIRADFVVWACEAAAPKANGLLADVIGVQRKSCGRLGKSNVLLLSEQLLPLLTAAGVTEEPNAQV